MTERSTDRPPTVAGRADGAEVLGLRERKKVRTRANIRDHALRLFRAQGYHATTVEQIAAAAEVSPATFFRYFPAKEDVVLQDDFDLVALSAFEAQPPELGPVAAYRAAVAAAFSAMTAAELDEFTEGAQLMLSIPEVRARVIDELARTIDVLAEAIARRAVRGGLVADHAASRSTAGAIIGVVIAATLPWHDAMRDGGARAELRSIFERIDAGLQCLDAGLPLAPAASPDGP